MITLRRLFIAVQEFRQDALPAPPLLPNQRFARARVAGGAGLLIGAAAALAWANSPLAASYVAARDAVLSVSIGGARLSAPLRQWINNGLLSVFFFSIGLCLRRQFSVGPLAERERASLPLWTALGAAVIPALVFSIVGRPAFGPRGWTVVIAGDGAFLFAADALSRRAVPRGLRDLSLGFSALSDAAAIAAIAVAGSAAISAAPAAAAVAVFSAIALSRRLGLSSRLWQAVASALFCWLWIISGFPVPIAGALLGATIAPSTDLDERQCAEAADEIMDDYDEAVEDSDADLCGALAGRLGTVAQRAEAPLDRLQRRLLPWLSFLVLPAFGWANAGIVLDRAARAALFGAAGAAIVGALVLGRCLGALGLGTLAVGRGRAWLPAGVNRSDLVGWSIAAGAGGTLTIFAAVTVLPPPARDTAVLAALAAALVATLAGAAALSWSLRVPREEESEQARSRAAEV